MDSNRSHTKTGLFDTLPDPDVSRRTPLAGRNRIACDECGDEIPGDLKRTVRWGHWNPESQTYRNHAQEDHYCQACWQDEFKRDAAAYYEVTDAQRLWDILDAADGDLVANLGALYVGSTPHIRIVDGELQGLGSSVRAEDYGDDRVIHFGSKRVDVDREWFDRTFADAGERGEDEPPLLVRLKPADETPFAGYRETHPDQATLDAGGPDQ